MTQPTNSKEVIVLVAENTDRQQETAFIANIQENEWIDHIVSVSSFNETLQHN